MFANQLTQIDAFLEVSEFVVERCVGEIFVDGCKLRPSCLKLRWAGVLGDFPILKGSHQDIVMVCCPSLMVGLHDPSNSCFDNARNGLFGGENGWWSNWLEALRWSGGRRSSHDSNVGLL